MTASSGRSRARGKAEDAQDHPAVQWAARLGFGAYGAVYLLLGWLAFHVALGERGSKVSKSGALAQMADQPLGMSLLWAASAGFAALVVYEGLRLAIGHRDRHGAKRWLGRVGSATKMVVFGLLCYSAAKVALGEGQQGGGTQGYTARLMEMPFGPVLVALVGLGILGYAGWSVVKGVTDRWRKELDSGGRTGDLGRALTVLGRVGYVSRGVAFGIVGGLFVWAALTHDARKSGGLDQAVNELRQAPFGPVLLGLVAAGLACYGLLNIAKVRHLAAQH